MSHPSSSPRAIFLEALDIGDLAQRERFLTVACGADVVLRRTVEGLLQAHNQAEGFLPDHPAHSADLATIRSTIEEFACSAHVPDIESSGARIGRYMLVRKIGEGGCGVVYLAEQEEPLPRKVALKVIKLGMDTRQVIARFGVEQQALALMDHPNIARVFDAGATEAGRPYFVMELALGSKITDFCEQNQLPIRRRLELFVQVCQAVQHAHSPLPSACLAAPS